MWFGFFFNEINHRKGLFMLFIPNFYVTTNHIA